MRYLIPIPILMFLAFGAAADPFSYARPAVAVTHVDLDLRVSFEQRKIAGIALLTVNRSSPDTSEDLVLDTKDLVIRRVDDGRRRALAFSLGARDPILGSPIRITLPPHVTRVRVDYETGSHADALQWLSGAQTASRRPFLYTQSGTIHARSWIPIQDSPSIRFTYDATVHAPRDLRAVMSATRVRSWRSSTRFRMTHPIPAYLVALAVGDLAYHAWDARTGVWAEAPSLDAAAWEFADTPRMLHAAEDLLGPYRWDRYDLLVMPPSFPYGGVENAQLTFVTPTLIAGDRSLVSTIAHELAHSWSGNLVTQATWNDVWLNEGLTVYLERRLVEALYGPERAAIEWAEGRERLIAELPRIPSADQHLLVGFSGRDPDEVLSNVPYEKGALFFLALERRLGRGRLDAFLRRFFEEHAFRSISTSELLAMLPDAMPTRAWIDEPGLPDDAPAPRSAALETAAAAARAWSSGSMSAADLPARDWVPQQWARFLGTIPDPVTPRRLAEIDASWRLTATRNSAILVPWLLLGIRADYAPAIARLDGFLHSVGRAKTVRQLYAALRKQPGGRERAAAIYCSARAGYHPVTTAILDRDFDCDGLTSPR